MKRFYWAISIFGLMFLGYPDVAATVGKYFGLFLEQLIGFCTGYGYIGFLDKIADFLYSGIEKINLTYLGALAVAEAGSMIIYAVYRLFAWLKTIKFKRVSRVSYKPKKLDLKLPVRSELTSLKFK